MEQIKTIKKKQSQGRRKIEIKRIEDKCSRQVTFSKRRSGLFRKASELCVLCGAEAAIFVVSPKGKVFTFGHPSVERIINRYEEKHEASGECSKFDYAEMNRHVEKLKVLEAEKNHLKEMSKQEIDKVNGIGEKGFWWEKEFRGMGFEDLEKFRGALQVLRNNVNKKADEKAAMAAIMTYHEYPLMINSNEDTKQVIIPPPPPGFGFTFSNFS